MDANAMGGQQPGGNLPGPMPNPPPPHWYDPQGQPFQPGYPVPGQDYPTGGHPEPNWFGDPSGPGQGVFWDWLGQQLFPSEGGPIRIRNE